MNETTALVVVDLQYDFLGGGTLAVGEGDDILPGVRERMSSRDYALCVATQDWHPPGHVSFASSHPGAKPFDAIELYGRPQTLWPDHCVQGTHGAELHDALPFERIAIILRKGMDPATDSYSGFRNNWDAKGDRPSTGLAGYLRDRGIREVHICGLARDYCCKWTAEDAVSAGFRTSFLWGLSRSVSPADDDRVRGELLDRGVNVMDRLN